MRNGKSEPSPVPDGTFRSLIRVIGLLRRTMDPYFAMHGISPAQWAVLRTLARTDSKRGLMLSEISDQLLVRPPSVTTVVDRLSRMRLVKRQASQEDQRVRYIQITASGSRLLKRAEGGHARRVEEMFDTLSKDEREQLKGFLTRLGDRMETLAEPVLSQNGDH